MKKDKPVIVEYLFIGSEKDFFACLYSRTWKRWRAYRDEKSARMALENYKAKFKFLDFRIKAT